MEQNLDEKIGQIKEKIKKEKETLDVNYSFGAKTNLSFGPNHVTPSVTNLRAIIDETNLLIYLAQLEIVHEKAISIMKENDFDFEIKYNGFTFDEWKHDFIGLIKKIQIVNKRNRLTKLEKELEKLMSEEGKRKNQFNDLLTEINSIL